MFGNHLHKVPAEEIFKLSQAEVEAFTSMKHHAFQNNLALVTNSNMPSAEVAKRYSEWQLVENINKAADKCRSVNELAQVYRLSQELNSFQTSYMKKEIANLTLRCTDLTS